MGEVRGKGLMVAVELVKDRETKQPAKDWRDNVIRNAFQKGLLILGCGENSIRFCPALTASGFIIVKVRFPAMVYFLRAQM